MAHADSSRLGLFIMVKMNRTMNIAVRKTVAGSSTDHTSPARNIVCRDGTK